VIFGTEVQPDKKLTANGRKNTASGIFSTVSGIQPYYIVLFLQKQVVNAVAGN
jgi:hypothetical protein